MKNGKLKIYYNRYVLITPLKFRRILKQFKNFNVYEIFLILKFLPYRPAKIIFKLLKSFLFSLYNKKNIKNLNKILLLQKFLIFNVNCGPILKRLKPKARGKNTIIKKRLSHISILF